MSSFKPVRCHYFDDNGNPIKPYCRDGVRCRFVHPEDSKWPFGSPRIQFKTESHSREPTPITARSRAPPLVPQSDLFRCSTNTDHDYRHGGHREGSFSFETHNEREIRDKGGKSFESKTSGDSRLRGRDPEVRESGKREHWPARDASQSRDARDKIASRYTAKIESNDNLCDRIDFSQGAADVLNPDVTMTRSTPMEKDTTVFRPCDTGQLQKKGIERINRVFRDMADISARTTLTAVEIQGTLHKLHSLRAVQTTLSNISPTASLSLAPIIAELDAQKERLNGVVEAEERKWKGLWGEMCNEIRTLVDGVMKDERRDQRDGRRRMSPGEIEETQGDDEERRERKRRRMSDSGRSQHPPAHQGFERMVDDADTREMLIKLQRQVDRQGDIIGFLVKENEALKSDIQSHCHIDKSSSLEGQNNPPTSSYASRRGHFRVPSAGSPTTACSSPEVARNANPQLNPSSRSGLAIEVFEQSRVGRKRKDSAGARGTYHRIEP